VAFAFALLGGPALGWLAAIGLYRLDASTPVTASVLVGIPTALAALVGRSRSRGMAAALAVAAFLVTAVPWLVMVWIYLNGDSS
jgi:hypothetical protein